MQYHNFTTWKAFVNQEIHDLYKEHLQNYINWRTGYDDYYLRKLSHIENRIELLKDILALEEIPSSTEIEKTDDEEIPSEDLDYEESFIKVEEKKTPRVLKALGVK